MQRKIEVFAYCPLMHSFVSHTGHTQELDVIGVPEKYRKEVERHSLKIGGDEVKAAIRSRVLVEKRSAS